MPRGEDEGQPDALAALAEPSRRAILGLLCERERPVGELVERLALSQPAVSQHLKVLLEARLVTVRPEGRQRFYRASAAGLAQARDEVERYWLAALAQARREIEAKSQAKGRRR